MREERRFNCTQNRTLGLNYAFYLSRLVLVLGGSLPSKSLEEVVDLPILAPTFSWPPKPAVSLHLPSRSPLDS